MSEIFKGFNKVTSGLLGGLSGLLGGKPPKNPSLLTPPSYSDNATAALAATNQRNKLKNTQGRQSTLLSVDPSQTNPGLTNPLKSLLGA